MNYSVASINISYYYCCFIYHHNAIIYRNL